MSKEHLIREMKAAVRAGEGERAYALQNATETPEVKGTEIDFVPASAEAQSMFGMRNCIIIRQLPADVMKRGDITEYGQYLWREARRQKATAYYSPEEKDYILVQFPGGSPEVYSETAFIGSLMGIYRQNLRQE